MNIPMKFHYISLLLLGQWMFICIVRLIICYRRYAALSHSWGKAQVITATSQTLNQYKRCLPYTQLPQTFRDAIAIARRLAIGLLWIDSLCIIQDSTLDWEEQAARMGSVYANATLVIAAESALDGSGGCFISDGERAHIPFQFECPSPEGSKSTVYARPNRRSGSVSPFCSSHTRQAWSHLSTRAWVYQEQLLGRRILHYTKSEMAWTCNSANLCECRIRQGRHGRAGFQLRSVVVENLIRKSTATAALPSQNRVPQEIIPEEGSLPKSTIFNMWNNLIEEYTRRSVTFATDRLPAISGIAAACKQHFSGQYMFGIWQDHLPEALLWSVSVTKTRQSRRIDSSYAPSWSWASITGHAEYHHELAPVEVSLEILDISYVPIGLNPYGPGNGSIKTSGYLLPVKVNHSISLANEPVLAEEVYLATTISLSLDFFAPTAEGHVTRLPWNYRLFIDVHNCVLADAELHHGDECAFLIVIQTPKSFIGILLSRSSKSPSAFQRVARANVLFESDSDKTSALPILGEKQEVILI